MNDSTKAFAPMALWIVFKEGWKGVMTIQNSPLRKLPPQVAFMTFLILAFMWSGIFACLLYTSPSPRDAHESRMPSSA